MTAERDAVRTVVIRGLPIRVSERPAQGALTAKPPLLLCNGIGASLEALQPFVDALHPDRGVVRFDVPGTGGSAAPPLPYPGRDGWQPQCPTPTTDHHRSPR